MNGKAVAALIVVLLAGGGIALALSSSDDDDGGNGSAQTSTTSEKKNKDEEQKKDDQKQEDSGQSDEEEIEQAINQYIAQSDDTETQTIECDAIVDDVCVQVEGVDVNGDEATAKLENGTSFELKRDGGQWKVSGFERPEVERPEVERPEVEKPDVQQPQIEGGGAEAPQQP
jgi:hypothetical protein